MSKTSSDDDDIEVVEIDDEADTGVEEAKEQPEADPAEAQDEDQRPAAEPAADDEEELPKDVRKLAARHQRLTRDVHEQRRQLEERDAKIAALESQLAEKSAKEVETGLASLKEKREKLIDSIAEAQESGQPKEAAKLTAELSDVALRIASVETLFENDKKRQQAPLSEDVEKANARLQRWMRDAAYTAWSDTEKSIAAAIEDGLAKRYRRGTDEYYEQVSEALKRHLPDRGEDIDRATSAQLPKRAKPVVDEDAERQKQSAAKVVRRANLPPAEDDGAPRKTTVRLSREDLANMEKWGRDPNSPEDRKAWARAKIAAGVV